MYSWSAGGGGHSHSCPALNEELHQQLQQEEECFQVKEAKLNKRLKKAERKVGKKIGRWIMRQMQKYS